MIEVWGIPLDEVLWYCVGGGSFFSGCLLLVIAVCFGFLAIRTWHYIPIYLLAFIALFFIFMAAMPLNNFFYILWLASLIAVFSAIHTKFKKRIAIAVPFLVVTTIALCIEIPNYLIPSIPPGGYNRVFIIGDSISDGIGTDQERTWPKIVKENGFEVIDASKAGATSVTALRRQVDFVSKDEGIVVVEIGGNDALMGTPLDEYEKSLRQILLRVTHDKHKVIMLEVPVLPWHIEYGRVLRKLANEYEVTLIPKKFLAGVFSAKDATLDLAHLSPKGHELMAKGILSLIEKAK